MTTLPSGYDRRLTPANGRVAAAYLRGEVAATEYVSGAAYRIKDPVVDILHAPHGRRERQLLCGWQVDVFEQRDGYCFIRSGRDGYVGYVPETALIPDHPVSHWVTSPATHLYSEADMKSPEVALLSLGGWLDITAEHARFFETRNGLFVPKQHIAPLSFRFDDPVAVAESLIGTPYLWGGNSRSGLDCSALVQAAFQAAGRACPGDSDMQERDLAPGRPMGNTVERGDLLFWKGHVAMAVDAERIIHANAGHMAVAYEGLEEAITRIEVQGDGKVTSRIRP